MSKDSSSLSKFSHISDINLSLLTAIDNCNKLMNDMKVEFKNKFTSLEVYVGTIASGYKSIIERLENLEKLVKTCLHKKHSCCEDVIKKISNIEELLKVSQSQRSISSTSPVTSSQSSKQDDNSSGLILSAPVVLVPNQKSTQVRASLGLDSAIQVITLNSELDYPSGSWLGDENNVECRVRCAISPSNLLHVNTFCQTPEKMAVTLLDYLFPRDVLAVSNLSGKGKHGKKQLDPLMIYGIRCHLMYKFHITEKDWFRIKHNIDSKCRTAWRKKLKGLPLGGIMNTQDSVDNSSKNYQIMSENGDSIIVSGSYVTDEVSEELDGQVFHTEEGDIKVIRATQEQLEKMHESHQIHVLTDEEGMPVRYAVLQEDQNMLTEEPLVQTGQSLNLESEQTLIISPVMKSEEGDLVVMDEDTEFIAG